MDLFKARANAFSLLQQDFDPVSDKKHTTYSPIYLASTSNTKDTLGLYKDAKTVLTVGGTGAHAFEAALNGATHVDMFDINILQQVYYLLYSTAIEYLDYDDFIKYFTVKECKRVMTNNDIKHLLSNEMYYQLQFFFPEEVEYVLGPIFEFTSNFDIFKSNLLRSDYLIDAPYLKRNISYYNKDQYYKLQQILRSGSCTFTYDEVSLIDVPKYYKDKKYDLILLDNILQYYKDIQFLETPYEVNQFLQKKLMQLVNPNGTIQACYGFEVASDAFKTKNNLSVTNPDAKHPIAQFMIKEDMANGICSNLYPKWNNYDYDFIPGVEGEGKENVILSLKNKQ